MCSKMYVLLSFSGGLCSCLRACFLFIIFYEKKTFSGDTIVALKVLDVDNLTFEQSIALAIVEEKNDADVVHLVKACKLSASALDTYKDERPVSADQIYVEMFETRDQYPELMKISFNYTQYRKCWTWLLCANAASQ